VDHHPLIAAGRRPQPPLAHTTHNFAITHLHLQSLRAAEPTDAAAAKRAPAGQPARLVQYTSLADYQAAMSVLGLLDDTVSAGSNPYCFKVPWGESGKAAALKEHCQVGEYKTGEMLGPSPAGFLWVLALAHNPPTHSDSPQDFIPAMSYNGIAITYNDDGALVFVAASVYTTALGLGTDTTATTGGSGGSGTPEAKTTGAAAAAAAPAPAG
jgi:hypothetical protein